MADLRRLGGMYQLGMRQVVSSVCLCTVRHALWVDFNLKNQANFVAEGKGNFTIRRSFLQIDVFCSQSDEVNSKRVSRFPFPIQKVWSRFLLVGTRQKRRRGLCVLSEDPEFFYTVPSC